MSPRLAPRRARLSASSDNAAGRLARRSTAIDRKSRCGCSRAGPRSPIWRSGDRGSSRRSASATRWRIDATAYRLVHGEADLLPSLIVDRYGDYLVRAGAVAGRPTGCCPRSRSCSSSCVNPAGILARNDPRVRLLEGLEQRVEVLHGDVPERIEVREGHVDLRSSTRTAARRPGCSSISARTAWPPRSTRAAGCSTRSATTAASRSRWRRVRRGPRHRHLGGRRRAHPRRTRSATA